jgi:thiamine-phosphate pyrophosphorylase
MMLDVRLLAIVDPDVLGQRDLVVAAQEAEAGGATIVQLRMKRAGAGAMLAAAQRLRAVLTVPLFVNDRADVAWAAGAAGVHVGEEDIPPEVVRAAAPGPCLIGVSVGSGREAAQAREASADYWSIGSVFATTSKPDAGPAIGVAGFRALAALAPPGMPLVGIGGINAGNAGDVIRAGGHGVAVISAIFSAEAVREATQRLREAVDAALRGEGGKGEPRRETGSGERETRKRPL